MSNLPPAARAPLLVLGFVALVSGIAGGLVRLGVDLPAPTQGIAWHGTLMASAFFGALIALERAVALGRAWAYAAPAASGLGGLALLATQPLAGAALHVAAAVLFVIASLVIWWRQRALHTGVLALGALCLLCANLVLLTSVEFAIPYWIAFFVLTIGGERLELSRLVPVPRGARHLFAALCVALVVAAAFMRLALLGVLLAALAAWLARYDLATRTVRTQGITRYIALCLLAGYVWLAAGGALLALDAPRDAALHAILLGFVFSMVFGHAPVIFPAVLRIALPYRAVFYLPLAVLHASVLVRVLAPLAGPGALEAGALGNAAAIGLFIVCAAGSALAAPRR